MKEIQADIWDILEQYPCRYLLVPTNGCWTAARTRAVMGAGFARQVAERYPIAESRLGEFLHMHYELMKLCDTEHALEDELWNIPYPLVASDESRFGEAVYSFPTKRSFITPDQLLPQYDYLQKYQIDPHYSYPGWRGPASLALIARSARLFYRLWSEQTTLATAEHNIVVLPRPGVGRGELPWSAVKPILEGIFVGDAFWIVDQTV